MDYLAEAERTKTTFLNLALDTTDWKYVKETDGVKMFSRKADEQKAGVMFKCELDLNYPPAKVYLACDPSKSYRIKWDGFLDDLAVVQTVNDNVHLIHHVTKSALKNVMSPRDSVDVVATGETDGYYYVAAASVDCPEVPANPKYVRVTQYPCGYVILKDDKNPDVCRFVLIMNADLKLNSITNFVTDMIKPTLVMQKINYLKEGLSKLEIN